MAKSARTSAAKAKLSPPANKGKGKPAAKASSKADAGKASMVGKLVRAMLGSGKAKPAARKPAAKAAPSGKAKSVVKTKPVSGKAKVAKQASPAKTKASPAKPKVSVAKPKTSAAKPKASAAKPKVSPAKPKASVAKPKVSPAKPQTAAISRKPVATGSKAAEPTAGLGAIRVHKPVPVPRGVVVAKAVAPSAEAGRRAKGGPQPQRKAQAPGKRLKLPEGYLPSAKESYMCARHQEFFRQSLEKWRADLVEESKQTIDNLRDEVRDVGDEAERATRETENSLELRTRDRYRKLISKIDETLRRLDDGQYGYCVDTGDEIGLERLIARPTAERTVDAQERWEHRQRQMGE